MSAHFSKRVYTERSRSGFTLIELLVVISIIAIISVIAIALFSNVQADARDSKRKAELEAIANVLEVNKSAGNYNPILPTNFGGGVYPGDGVSVIALDPQDYPYCIAASTSSTPPATPTDVTEFSTIPLCPNTPVTYNKITGLDPPTTTISWKLCTRLENKGTPTVFCRTNVQ